ncbi:hypothetical protein, partial [Aneurinibacillus migulanus]|uniref:hypothetical protein n=1 Tax=Aneurinibacillus migulanus TaxID=47500 RepID=UPI001C3F5A1C
ASVCFSDRSRPPPFLLFLPPTIKTCRFIKLDVYNESILVHCRRVKLKDRFITSVIDFYHTIGPFWRIYFLENFDYVLFLDVLRFEQYDEKKT